MGYQLIDKTQTKSGGDQIEIKYYFLDGILSQTSRNLTC